MTFYFYLRKGERIIRLPGLTVVIIRIILRVSSNCLISLFTSCTDVPLPAAIRCLREPFRIEGFLRSCGVIE